MPCSRQIRQPVPPVLSFPLYNSVFPAGLPWREAFLPGTPWQCRRKCRKISAGLTDTLRSPHQTSLYGSPNPSGAAWTLHQGRRPWQPPGKASVPVQAGKAPSKIPGAGSSMTQHCPPPARQDPVPETPRFPSKYEVPAPVFSWLLQRFPLLYQALSQWKSFSEPLPGHWYPQNGKGSF